MLMACRVYCGSVSNIDVPPELEILEIRRHPTQSDIRRLKSHTSYFKLHIAGYLIDPEQYKVTATRWQLANPRRRFLQRLVEAPRLSPVEATPLPIFVMKYDHPWCTYALLGIIAVAFGLEAYLSGEVLDVPSAALVAMGGRQVQLVLAEHEWYRMLSSALLHGGLLHLALNSLCLWMGGRILENMVGRSWLLALFLIGTLGGSLMSLVTLDPLTVSTGASGAIMGLCAAAFVLSFRLSTIDGRDAIQRALLGTLIPSLLPLFSGVNYGGHFGGAIAGTLAGLVLLKSWPQESLQPRLGRLPQILAVVSLLCFGTSAVLAVRGYETYDVAHLLIPKDELPETNEDGAQQSAQLVASYPHDPRARFFRAMALLSEGRHGDALEQMLLAMAEKPVLATLHPRFQRAMHGMYSLLLFERGDLEAARVEAEVACSGEVDEKLVARLRRAGLCL